MQNVFCAVMLASLIVAVLFMLFINFYFFHKLSNCKKQEKCKSDDRVAIGMIGCVELNYRDDRLSVAINHDKSMGDSVFNAVVCELMDSKEKIQVGDIVRVVKIDGCRVFVELKI